MKYIYDRSTDSLAIIFAEGRRYRDSVEIHDGIVIDYDTSGRAYAIEFPDRASRFVDTEGLASGREVHVIHPDTPSRVVAFNGQALRLRRTELGLTQGQLAETLGVHANTVARWERGELTIENPKMLELALQSLARKTSSGGAVVSRQEPDVVVAIQGAIKDGKLMFSKGSIVEPGSHSLTGRFVSGKEADLKPRNSSRTASKKK